MPQKQTSSAEIDELTHLCLRINSASGHSTKILFGLYTLMPPAEVASQCAADLAVRLEQTVRDLDAKLYKKCRSAEIGREADRIASHLRRSDICLLHPYSRHYPGMLQEIPDRPLVLFVRGNLDCLRSVQIAIVGSRRASPPALRLASSLARQLSEAGVVVTSGLARGCDIAAHRGTLEAIENSTIADSTTETAIADSTTEAAIADSATETAIADSATEVATGTNASEAAMGVSASVMTDGTATEVAIDASANVLANATVSVSADVIAGGAVASGTIDGVSVASGSVAGDAMAGSLFTDATDNDAAVPASSGTTKANLNLTEGDSIMSGTIEDDITKGQIIDTAATDYIATANASVVQLTSTRQSARQTASKDTANTTGIANTTGVTGVIGDAGDAGAVGISGAADVANVVGVTGAAGDAGVVGGSGEAGDDGATDNVGVVGVSGVSGAANDVGDASVVGVTAAADDAGGAGGAGDAGVTGGAGITGVAGDADATGAVGVASTTDNVGVVGVASAVDKGAAGGFVAAGTVAVLGSGIDLIYPAQHRRIADRIAQNGGCLISEFSPGTPPLPLNFPRRNRIIAGLSVATVVIEAGLQSGSLISARLANEYGRDVFAVPGSPVHALSRGCHKLIKAGAHLFENCADLADVLGTRWPVFAGMADAYSPAGTQSAAPKSAKMKLPAHLKRFLSHIGDEGIDIGEFAQTCCINIVQAQTVLLDLEVKGIVRQTLTGKYFKMV